MEEFLFARALEHGSPKLPFRLACEYLSSSRLIRPGVVTSCSASRPPGSGPAGKTWHRVEPMLTVFLRGELDGMLVSDPLLGRTRLAWLGTGPTSSAPAAVKGELEKLAYLRGMGAHTLDLSVLPAERRRFLAGLGRRLTAQNLARRESPTAGTRSCWPWPRSPPWTCWTRCCCCSTRRCPAARRPRGRS